MVEDLDSSTVTMGPAPEATSQSAPERPTQEAPIPNKSQVVPLLGFPNLPDGNLKMFPIMYPALVPGIVANQNNEQVAHGTGLYAVPVMPFAGTVAGIPSNTLIPLTYNVPTRRPGTSEVGAAGVEPGQVGQQQQQQLPHQRQIIVRRFQIAFQLDLLLILKLAAVIFLFNQDGSRQRLALLVFFAALIYLYQTGTLAPLVRWISLAMRRAAAPPRPARLAARTDPPARPENENIPAAEGLHGGENDNRLPDDVNPAVENEAAVEPGAGNQWWGIVKEIQMIVFGFITSLLPGFHNLDRP
ncbi:hypothetical protein AKJ16_DCAP07558 [Drosera capensis]